MCKNCRCGYPERRWLQFLILRVVYENSSHGYGILKKMGEVSLGRHNVKSGTLYTTLRRMEQEGLLKSHWEKNDGPDKRIYEATKKGEKYLKKWLEMVLERRKMMDRMANFYDEHFGGADNED